MRPLSFLLYAAAPQNAWTAGAQEGTGAGRRAASESSAIPCMEYEVQEIKTGDSVLTVSTTPAAILFGGRAGQLRMRVGNVETVLWQHRKSVRSIATSGDLFGCASYDCTAAIFRNGVLFDTVEGPETEIKCLCFSEDNRFVAMSTRGRTVWVCRIGREIEVDAVLEDHLHDVKGVAFRDGCLYSFGYDGTIKVYERLDLDESWELIQNIEEKDTIWSLGFYSNIMVSCSEDGWIRMYGLTHEWVLCRAVEASVYPIYSMAVFDGLIGYVLNRDSLGILSMELEEVLVIERIGEINHVHFCSSSGDLVCGMEDGAIKIVKLGQARMEARCLYTEVDRLFEAVGELLGAMEALRKVVCSRVVYFEALPGIFRKARPSHGLQVCIDAGDFSFRGKLAEVCRDAHLHVERMSSEHKRLRDKAKQRMSMSLEIQ
ncbi:UNVERIFIED_CONTAM: hypothetical protein PYX00_011296 [Menopon gallinae]|uniref:Uncharacterized protein n=1 Tax=Menopon gallinae TaxID=328185 RepID=A0AAW2H748_9NEOP